MVATPPAGACSCLVALLALGCSSAMPSVRWQGNEPFRPRPDCRLESPYDVANLVADEAVTSNDYLSLDVRRVFFRNLPGIIPPTNVMVSAEVHGLLPGGRVYKTVLSFTEVKENSFLELEDVALTPPVRFQGRDIEVILDIVPMAPDEAQAAKDYFGKAKEALGRYTTVSGAFIDLAGGVVEHIVTKLTRPKHIFQYRVGFKAYEDHVGDASPLLFVRRGTFLLVATPPQGEDLAWAEGYVDRKYLEDHLCYRDPALSDAHYNQPYFTTPYLVLNIDGRSRFVGNPLEFKTAYAEAQRHLDIAGDPDEAYVALQKAKVHLLEEGPALSQRELNYHQEAMAVFEQRLVLAKGRATGTGSSRQQVAWAKYLLDRLKTLSGKYDRFLTAAERDEVGARMEELRRLHDELVRGDQTLAGETMRRPDPADLASLAADLAPKVARVQVDIVATKARRECGRCRQGLGRCPEAFVEAQCALSERATATLGKIGEAMRTGARVQKELADVAGLVDDFGRVGNLLGL